MKISIIGTGYVGLTVGICLANFGNDIICVDIDKDKIEKLKKGILPIYEPGLKEVLDRNINESRISFTTDIKEGIQKSTNILLLQMKLSPQAALMDIPYNIEYH